MTWKEVTYALWKAEGEDGEVWTIMMNPAVFARPFRLNHSVRGSCGSYASLALAKAAAERKEATGLV